MKPLSQMTFEEASRARTALVAIANILVNEGLVEHTTRTTTTTKVPVTTPKPKPKPTKTRHRRKNGHLATCANPACYRRKAGKTYIRHSKHQRFCRPACGTDYFNRIRNYARAVVLDSTDVKAKWLKSDPWLGSAEVNKDVARIIRLEENIARRDAAKAKHQTKGVVLLRNTPQASKEA